MNAYKINVYNKLLDADYKFLNAPERVVKFMLEEGSINPLQAWTKLGVYRLAAVIHLLKRRGTPIIASRKSAQNKFGEKCHFAEYRLVGKK